MRESILRQLIRETLLTEAAMTPVIAAHGLADDWEVVAKLEPSMLVKE
jgi:hypothetical protein